MAFNPFRVIFKMDGTGTAYDKYEPIHLDDLLTYCLAPYKSGQRQLQKNDIPVEVSLPLRDTVIDGHKIWHASALFPVGLTLEATQYYRRRFRQDRIEMVSGHPNLSNGVYRDYNNPLQLLLCHAFEAFGYGDRYQVQRALRRHIKGLGAKRGYGKGRVISIDVENIDEDYSLIRDGKAMRWLPDHNGLRLVRTRPPYWNNTERVLCCEVGDEYQINR